MNRLLVVAALALLPACEATPSPKDPTMSAAQGDGDHDSDHDGDHDGDHDADHDDHDHAPVPDDPTTRAAAAKVRVIQGEDIGCQSEAIGLIDVHSHMHSTDKALDVLKRKAAVLGADAVVGVDFNHGEGGTEPTHLSGMAVRCSDLLHGRQYDVLGQLDVTGKMGHEDDAFDELRTRARDIARGPHPGRAVPARRGRHPADARDGHGDSFPSKLKEAIVMRSVGFALVLLALPACGNTYHPEWHPVTVSHFSQNLDYPVTVQNGGDPAMRSPVIIAPAPMPAPPPALR